MEVEGEHYYFVSPERFDELVATGQMLEWAVVHGKHRYGTPRGPVIEAAHAGRPVILEIDLEGARQVRASLPEATFVFLAPPSWEVLVKRLEGRGTEQVEERARRLETARVELEAEGEFDVTIVNDQLEDAVAELGSILGVVQGSE